MHRLIHGVMKVWMWNDLLGMTSSMFCFDMLVVHVLMTEVIQNHYEELLHWCFRKHIRQFVFPQLSFAQIVLLSMCVFTIQLLSTCMSTIFDCAVSLSYSLQGPNLSIQLVRLCHCLFQFVSLIGAGWHPKEEPVAKGALRNVARELERHQQRCRG